MVPQIVDLHRARTVASGSQEDPEARLLLRIDEAARLLGIGTTLAYEMVGQGRLPHVRLGRSVRVPRAALEAWIAANTVAASPPTGNRP